MINLACYRTVTLYVALTAAVRSIRAGARESVGAAVRALRSCDALCCSFMHACVVV